MRTVVRLLIVGIALGTLVAPARAQNRVPSPQDVLGYGLGERFTDHAAIVRYFETLAAAVPNLRIRRYGTTNEGRPLLHARIARPDRMDRIDDLLRINRELADINTTEARAREIAATNPA